MRRTSHKTELDRLATWLACITEEGRELSQTSNAVETVMEAFDVIGYLALGVRPSPSPQALVELALAIANLNEGYGQWKEKCRNRGLAPIPAVDSFFEKAIFNMQSDFYRFVESFSIITDGCAFRCGQDRLFIGQLGKEDSRFGNLAYIAYKSKLPFEVHASLTMTGALMISVAFISEQVSVRKVFSFNQYFSPLDAKKISRRLSSIFNAACELQGPR
jgi:hypothetical protein